MNSINEQTLTLAAVCQVAYWVQKISRSGQIDEDELALLLNSVLITSPENTMEVYGGEISHLKMGLTT